MHSLSLWSPIDYYDHIIIMIFEKQYMRVGVQVSQVMYDGDEMTTISISPFYLVWGWVFCGTKIPVICYTVWFSKDSRTLNPGCYADTAKIIMTEPSFQHAYYFISRTSCIFMHLDILWLKIICCWWIYNGYNGSNRFGPIESGVECLVRRKWHY